MPTGVSWIIMVCPCSLPCLILEIAKDVFGYAISLGLDDEETQLITNRIRWFANEHAN